MTLTTLLLSLMTSSCSLNVSNLDPVEDRRVSLANIQVVWQAPATYKDVKAANSHNARFRERTFSQIEQHLKTLAADLPNNLTLSFVFTNVDLAGDVQYLFSTGQEIRIVKSQYWPKMRFSVTVFDDGKPIAKQDVELTDMMFMDRSMPRFKRNDSLRYEKRMLSQWFAEDLTAQIQKII